MGYVSSVLTNGHKQKLDPSNISYCNYLLDTCWRGPQFRLQWKWWPHGAKARKQHYALAQQVIFKLYVLIRVRYKGFTNTAIKLYKKFNPTRYYLLFTNNLNILKIGSTRKDFTNFGARHDTQNR